MAIPSDIFVVVLASVLFAAAGGLAVLVFRKEKTINGLREEKARLETLLEAERKAAGEKIAAFDEARALLSETFGALSNEALKANSEQFLQLAAENLGRLRTESQSDLEKRQQAVEGLVKPIREALERTSNEIHRMEEERKQAYGALRNHLENMAVAQAALQSETRSLVKALRRPEVRGQWGELTLRRLAELAGMVRHCDFYEQEHVATEDGAIRPDMVVRMPDEREIIVDAKTPLDAYLTAVEADTDEERRVALERHARHVRERVRHLGSKAYWSRFKKSPDFVVLFIPGEQFLSSALDLDRTLLEDAMAQGVIIATPTSFVALLRAVAYGWRQQALAENAERIRDLGEDLYKRLAVFTGHLSRLGRSLGSSVEQYNKAVGSFDRQVLPGARKFTEMGVGAKKEIENLDPLDKGLRVPAGEE